MWTHLLASSMTMGSKSSCPVRYDRFGHYKYYFLGSKPYSLQAKLLFLSFIFTDIFISGEYFSSFGLNDFLAYYDYVQAKGTKKEAVCISGLTWIVVNKGVQAKYDHVLERCPGVGVIPLLPCVDQRGWNPTGLP